jgi:hypothetical protein
MPPLLVLAVEESPVLQALRRRRHSRKGTRRIRTPIDNSILAAPVTAANEEVGPLLAVSGHVLPRDPNEL